MVKVINPYKKEIKEGELITMYFLVLHREIDPSFKSAYVSLNSSKPTIPQSEILCGSPEISRIRRKYEEIPLKNLKQDSLYSVSLHVVGVVMPIDIYNLVLQHNPQKYSSLDPPSDVYVKPKVDTPKKWKGALLLNEKEDIWEYGYVFNTLDEFWKALEDSIVRAAPKSDYKYPNVLSLRFTLF